MNPFGLEIQTRVSLVEGAKLGHWGGDWPHTTTAHNYMVNLAEFDFIRVPSDGSLPPALDRTLDVVILDMNHSVANLGHDSLVHAVHESSRALKQETGIGVRVLSFDVRGSRSFPNFDMGRFRLFIGTGGPGHLDPRANDGSAPWSENVVDDPFWEKPYSELLESIVRDESVAYIAFCHSFGMLARWAGIARPVLRSEGQGGKSHGIVTYILTGDALRHPWFSRFHDELFDRPRFRVLDSRQFDLVPNRRNGYVPLAYEADRDGGYANALTMIELERDRNGIMPRVFAANHHPEVVDIRHMVDVLDEKLEKGEVTADWRQKRYESLVAFWNEPDVDERMRRTSRYTLLDLLAYHLRRIGEGVRSTDLGSRGEKPGRQT